MEIQNKPASPFGGIAENKENKEHKEEKEHKEDKEHKDGKGDIEKDDED